MRELFEDLKSDQIDIEFNAFRGTYFTMQNDEDPNTPFVWAIRILANMLKRKISDTDKKNKFIGDWLTMADSHCTNRVKGLQTEFKAEIESVFEDLKSKQDEQFKEKLNDLIEKYYQFKYATDEPAE